MIIPGLVSITYRKLTPEQIIPLAVEAELGSIEWGGDVHVEHGNTLRAREVRRLTQEAGLAVSAYGSYYRVGNSESQGLAFASVLDTASELGAEQIRVWAGAAGSAESDAALRNAVTDDLRRICDLAKQRSASVSLEFHGGTLTDTVASTLQLIADVGASNLTAYWQPPVGMQTEECVRGLQLLLPHVRNFHVFHWWPQATSRHALADGADRWRAYLTLLQDDVRRHASLEYIVDDDPRMLRADAATLKSLLAGNVV